MFLSLMFLSQANASPLEYKTSFRTRFNNYYKGDLLNLIYEVYRSMLNNSLHRGGRFHCLRCKILFSVQVIRNRKTENGKPQSEKMNRR